MKWYHKKKKILNKNPHAVFFEFNVSSYCNLNCSFCPEKSVERYDMSFSLFKKSIYDLKEVENLEGIWISGFCEPTLHPEIENFIRFAKQQLNCDIIMNSNGTTLTQKKIDEYKNLGLRYLIVSAYDKETYQNMRKIKSNIIFIQDRISNKNFVNNRNGYFKFKDNMKRTTCYYPFYMHYIDYNGDVTCCSHDFNKKNIIGNILKSSISTIIEDNKLKEIRLKLSRGKRIDIEGCSGCNVDGRKMGRKQYENWKKRNIH